MDIPYANLERVRMKQRVTRLSLPRAYLAVLAFLPLAACVAPRHELARTDYVLGTTCTIRFEGAGGQAALDAAFDRLFQLDGEFTVTREGSEVDAVNDGAGVRPVHVGPDVMAVLRKDLYYSTITSGRFDASVGPLVKLWGIGTDHARVPAPGEIRSALSLVDWKDIVLDDSAQTVFLTRKGMSLDLGSTTKGYAADEVAKVLRSRGVSSALIDLGGNVLAVGSKSGGSEWRIGIQNPDAPRGSSLGIVRVRNRTVVTSGVYERFFIKDGKRYHHILDTTNGYPVDNGLTSVTVITDRSFDADGLTTSLFAVGQEEGMKLARQAGVDAIFVDDKHRVFIGGSDISRIFELTDPSFTLATPAAAK